MTPERRHEIEKWVAQYDGSYPIAMPVVFAIEAVKDLLEETQLLSRELVKGDY